MAPISQDKRSSLEDPSRAYTQFSDLVAVMHLYEQVRRITLKYHKYENAKGREAWNRLGKVGPHLKSLPRDFGDENSYGPGVS